MVAFSVGHLFHLPSSWQKPAKLQIFLARLGTKGQGFPIWLSDLGLGDSGLQEGLKKSWGTNMRDGAPSTGHRSVLR